MVELNNIVNAAGLDSEAKTALEQLVEVRSKHAEKNRLLGQYYEAKQPTPSIGINNIPETVDVPARCDWAAKAVTSVSERVRMSGFTFAGDYKDATLERIERASGLSAGFNRHVASELIHGCMFATVQRTGNSAAVRTHTAETAAAIWDVAAQRIAAGFVIADCAARSGARPRPCRCKSTSTFRSASWCSDNTRPASGARRATTRRSTAR